MQHVLPTHIRSYGKDAWRQENVFTVRVNVNNVKDNMYCIHRPFYFRDNKVTGTVQYHIMTITINPDYPVRCKNDVISSSRTSFSSVLRYAIIIYILQLFAKKTCSRYCSNILHVFLKHF